MLPSSAGQTTVFDYGTQLCYYLNTLSIYTHLPLVFHCYNSTIMKQFISFVKKEFHHIFRDRRTLLILLGMPLVQITIFGFALTNEVKNARFVVLDNAKDAASQELI